MSTLFPILCLYLIQYMYMYMCLPISCHNHASPNRLFHLPIKDMKWCVTNEQLVTPGSRIMSSLLLTLLRLFPEFYLSSPFSILLSLSLPPALLHTPSPLSLSLPIPLFSLFHSLPLSFLLPLSLSVPLFLPFTPSFSHLLFASSWRAIFLLPTRLPKTASTAA